MSYMNAWSFKSDITANTYLKADFYLLEQDLYADWAAQRLYSHLGFAIYICTTDVNAIKVLEPANCDFYGSDPDDRFAFSSALSAVGKTVDAQTNRNYYTAFDPITGKEVIYKLLKTNLKTVEVSSNGGLAIDQRYEFVSTRAIIDIEHPKSGEKYVDFTFTITDPIKVEGVTYPTLSVSGAMDLKNVGEIVSIEYVSPTNLTDESNPKISIRNVTPESLTNLEFEMAYFDPDTQTAITIAKRTAPTATVGYYTIELTAAERDNMRAITADKSSFTVRFTAYSTLKNDTTVHTYHHLDEVTVVNNYPIINNLIVQEANDDVYALTGDRDVLVKYKSTAEFSFTPVAVKGATVVETTAQNGSTVFRDQYVGVFQDVESGDFHFYVGDSRGQGTATVLSKPMIEYFNPTCYVAGELELVGETTVDARLKVSGSYFNGSFGAVDNGLVIELRHTENDGNMGDWFTVTEMPTFNGNSYELETTVSGLIYMPTYDFQFRVKDKANTSYIVSSTLTKVLRPVYDWGEEDFNFNVPIYMNDKPVLRHNKDGNHTIISASGGRIHLRPNGTDNEDGELILYPDGTIKFGTADSKVDMVVDYGTEAMGSNGTWYWEKWLSGKAVCYGRRNFGRMDVLTPYTLNENFYMSSYFDQPFPTGLFVDVPETVSMNDTYWSMYRTASLSSEKINFSVLSIDPRTLGSSYIGFYVAGRWKEAE